MREIRVRIWTGKEYRYPPSIGEWDFEDCELFASYNKEAKAIEEYIGMKDKNAYAIYEGDIIKWEEPYISKPGNKQFIGTINFNSPSFFVLCRESVFSGMPGFIPHDCEIIGNIHENEFLLKHI